MKKYFIYSLLLISIGLSCFQTSCKTEKMPAKIADKSGAQLWGENCSRCHNAPGPGEFNDAHWDVIGLHMRVRANITETETAKIMQFLKDSNN